MQPEKEQLKALLEKYLQRTATSEEALLIRQWFWHLDVSEQVLFRNAAEEEEMRLKMRERIYARIKPEEVPVRKLHSFPLWLRAVAASFLLLMSLYLGYNHVYKQSEKPTAAVTIATDGNAIKKVKLPDGTEVTLNLFSKLEVKNGFNKMERRVHLVGEAFFEVKKDPNKPFIVESENLETQVLGTAFNVEAYEGEQQSRVSLLRGKVRVQNTSGKTQKFDLSPGQMLVHDQKNNTGTTEAIAAQNVTGWMDSRIIFNDVPLADAISRLRQRYSTEIQYAQSISLDGKRVTGEYRNGSVEEVLEAILLVHNLQFEKKGGTIYVTP